MPSIRKRMYGLIRTLSSPNASEGEGGVDDPASPDLASPESPPQEDQSFIYLYLTGRLRRGLGPEIYYGKTGLDLPRLGLRSPLSPVVVGTQSGPDGGLGTVPPVRKTGIASIANLDEELSISMDTDSLLDLSSLPHDRTPVTSHFLDCATDAALEFVDSRYDWDAGSTRAWGESRSLYEVNPLTRVPAGTPIADVFGVVARTDSAILALADGVNWGDRARLAARCAVRGAIDHLNDNLFHALQPTSTLDVFHHLLGSFHAGHQLILQEEGMLTTLCVAVVVPLADSPDWVVCACNVGDSLCFVYNQRQGVREVTLGSHDIREMRDMRDAGGALGPVDGVNPELQNLTCSMTVVEAGDLVFITSDGVSDNFDPVVGKFCVMKPPPPKAATEEPADLHHPPAHRTQPPVERQKSEPAGLINGTEMKQRNGKPTTLPIAPSVSTPNTLKLHSVNGLPAVEATQRHELMLLRMEDLLRHGVTVGDSAVASAPSLSHALLNFATQLTAAKRRTLEDPDLYQGDPRLKRMDQKQRRRLVRQKIGEMPGKLDHATVVAYKVGDWTREDALEERSRRPSFTLQEDQETTPTLPRKAVSEELTEVELFSPSAEMSAAIELAPEPPPTAELYISMRTVLQRRSHSAHSSAHTPSDTPDPPTPTRRSPSPPSPAQDSPPPTPTDSSSPPSTPTNSSPLPTTTTITTPTAMSPPPTLNGSPPPVPPTLPTSTPPATPDLQSASPNILSSHNPESQRSSSSPVPILPDSDSITLSDASEEVEVSLDLSAVEAKEEASVTLPIPVTLSIEDRVPMIDEDSSQSSSVSSGLADVLRVDVESSEAAVGIATGDFEELQSSLPSLDKPMAANSEPLLVLPTPSSTEDEGVEEVEVRKAKRHSIISSEPSPVSERPDADLVSIAADRLSIASDDPSVTVDFETAKVCVVEQAASAVMILPDNAETAAAIMNTSYYNATAYDIVLDNRVAPVSTEPTPASPLTQPEKKKGSMPQRTFARLESTLKRRKHRRNSPSRHTVAVDGSWLQRLGLGRKSETREGTPMTERAMVADRVAPPKSKLTNLFSGGTLRGRLRPTTSPEKGEEKSEMSHSHSSSFPVRPAALTLDLLTQPCDFRSPDTLL